MQVALTPGETKVHEEKIRSFLPVLERMVQEGEGLIAISSVEVIRLTKDPA